MRTGLNANFSEKIVNAGRFGSIEVKLCAKFQ